MRVKLHQALGLISERNSSPWHEKTVFLELNKNLQLERRFPVGAKAIEKCGHCQDSTGRQECAGDTSQCSSSSALSYLRVASQGMHSTRSAFWNPQQGRKMCECRWRVGKQTEQPTQHFFLHVKRMTFLQLSGNRAQI